MDCIYEFNGREFKTEEELNEYLLSNYFGVGFQKPSKDEIVDSIKKSQDSILFFDQDVEEGGLNAYDKAKKYAIDNDLTIEIDKESQERSKNHKYFFVDGDKLIEAISVTAKIDQSIAPFTGKIRPEGYFSQKIGSEFHEIAEEVIKNKGKVPKSLKGHRKKWANRVSKLYEEWTSDGSEVISEFKVINKYSKLAGTVDIAVISPSGDVKLFDFKFSRHEYNNKQKMFSNSLQLRAYERMLQMGEESLNMPKIDISDASVIHIKLKIGGESIEDKDDPTLGLVLEDVDVDKEPISYNDERFGNLRDTSAAKAKSMIRSKEEEVKLRINLKGPKTGTDFTTLQHITGIEDTSILNTKAIIRSRAAQKPTRGPKPTYFYRDHLGNRVYYKNEKARYDHGPEGKIAREKELKEDFLPILERHSRDTASLVMTYFEEGKTELFDAADDYDDQTAKQKKLDDVKEFFNKNTDRMLKLNTLRGFEHVGDDVVIIYKNFNDDTGDFSRLDIMSFNTVPNFSHHHGENRTTIFGNFLEDFDVMQLAKETGLFAFKPFENTEKNNKLFKLGLVAMQLKKNNPDLVIGDIVAVPVTNRYDIKSKLDRPARAPVKQILEQIRIMSQLGKKGKDFDGNPVNVEEQFGENVYALMTDEELLDWRSYGQRETEFYMEMFARQFAEKGDGNKLEEKYESLPAKLTDLLVLPELGESPNALREAIKAIKEDSEKKFQLIAILGERQEQIERLYKGTTQERNLDLRMEYVYLSSAIRELFGLTDDLDQMTDMHWTEQTLTSAGLTAIPVVDRFTKVVKERMMNIGTHFVDGMIINGKKEEGFLRRKEKPIQKLFEGRNKLRRNALGDDVTVYQDLMEERWFVVRDQDARMNTPEVAKMMKKYGAVWRNGAWMVRRKTGRFWTEETAAEEGKTLTDNQKQFIEWFQDIVKEGYSRTMTDKDRENFNSFWNKSWVPLMRSNATDILYKTLFERGEGKSPTKERLKVLWERISDRYKNMQEFYDQEVEDSMSLMSVFDKQLMNPAVESQNEYGGRARLNALGLEVAEDGETMLARLDHKDMIEGNLEKVANMFYMTSLRKFHLDPLIVLYKSVKNAVSLAEHQYFGKFDGIRNYLKVYVDNAFLNKRQIPNNELQRKIETLAMTAVSGTSAAIIGFNVYSWMKNFQAGYLHTMSNSVARAFAGEANMAEYRKSMRDVFQEVFMKRGGRFTNKMHSIMYKMGLADIDVERLMTDGRYQESGKQAFQSHIANWGNFAGDYLHRAFMASSQMHVDKSWEAWEEDSNGEWIYNEDKDPRFEGKKGESLKNAIKSRMRENDKLDENGRMRVPYTLDEIMTLQKEADLTFQNINTQDQPLYRQYGIGVILGQLGSWLVSKKERWYTKSQVTEHHGKWVTREVMDPKTGEVVDYITTWEGNYMEGMWQTLANLRVALKRHVKGQETISDYWGRMTPIERRNVGRVINDIAIAGAMVGSLHLIFGLIWEDDEWKENKTLYYLTIGAVQEIFLLEHLRAMSDKLSNPFPATMIAGRLIDSMTSLNPKQMWRQGAKYVGPVKLIPLVGEGLEDFNVIGE